MSRIEQLTRENLRSECYALLASCFYSPNRAELLQENTCLRLAETLGNLGLDAAAASARIMHEQLVALDEVELKVDHATLFVGPFELKAAPYGSVYCDGGRQLMGDSTLRASSCYAEAGLQLAIYEPADHIAVELEFMHYLSFFSAEATGEGDRQKSTAFLKKEQKFLREQLGPWMPDFCAAIITGADTLYFKALANCLLAFTTADMDHLNQQMTVSS